MKVIKIVLFLLVCLCSCTSELKPEEYIRWVKNQDNGLHKKKVVSDLHFDIQLMPEDYIKLKYNDSISENEKQQEDEMLYFHIKIKVADNKTDLLKYKLESEAEYYKRLYYYSYGFENDIYLEDGEKEENCTVFHFERSYDLGTERSFIVAFRNNDSNKDKTLVLNSSLLGVGPVKFKFTDKNIKSIPKLMI